MNKNKPTVLVIVGPTASGKSQLALALAEKLNGSIVNADAMQVYDAFPVLSAQPDKAEKNAAPHHLYATISPPQNSTAARWAKDAEKKIAEILAEGRLPILVGGTGMYLEFLLHGVSAIPDVPSDVRESVRRDYLKDSKALREKLRAADPELEARLRPNDAQRVIRAYEVYLATNTPLSRWQKQEFAAPDHPWRTLSILLLPNRVALYDAINTRFTRMLENGALDEVKTAVKNGWEAEHPVMKTVGVPELALYLNNQLSLKRAIEDAQQASRNYAKRQVTWFRNRFLKKETDAGRPVLVLETGDAAARIAEASAFFVQNRNE